MTTKKKKKSLGVYVIGCVLVMACIAAIGTQMYFAYMSGKYLIATKQAKREIYATRNEIVRVASLSPHRTEIKNIAASHLVIVEPVSVSISQ